MSGKVGQELEFSPFPDAQGLRYKLVVSLKYICISGVTVFCYEMSQVLKQQCLITFKLAQLHSDITVCDEIEPWKNLGWEIHIPPLDSRLKSSGSSITVVI